MEFEIVLSGTEIHGDNHIDIALGFINSETNYEETASDNGLYGPNDGVFKVSTPDEVLKHLKELSECIRQTVDDKTRHSYPQEIYLLSFDEGAKSEEEKIKLKDFEKLIVEAINNSENFVLIDYEEDNE